VEQVAHPGLIVNDEDRRHFVSAMC
jgi:hypothetical protein